MRLFQRVLLTASFLIVAINANAQLAALDGNWYSTQWKYGYVLKDGVGVATSTNSPNFQVGQKIIQLTATSPNTFTGQQVYTDGKFYKVNATLQADGRLYFEGEKNAKWVMGRIGAPTQASTPSNQATQTNAAASGSTSTSPSFDCSKASNPYEKAVCTNPILSSLDNQLAIAYRNARAKSVDPDALRKTQVDWIQNTRQCASNTSCIEKAYKDRIAVLGGGSHSKVSAPAQLPLAQSNPPQPSPKQAPPLPVSETHESKSSANVETHDAELVTTATAIIQEFNSNKLSASIKYKGKTVLIEGLANNIEPTTFRKPASVEITLKDSSSSFESVRIILEANEQQISLATKLSKGDYVRAVCKKVASGAMMGVLAEDCLLLEQRALTPVDLIDATMISIGFESTSRRSLENKYVGKRVQAKMFITTFEDRSGSRRMKDGNSPFFCDVFPSDLPNFPTKRGGYIVEGTFIVERDAPGLTRCKYIRNQ
jgi:uncharacterized protein